MFSNDVDHILRLAHAYAAARDHAISTVSLRAAGQGKLLDRLERGADLTTRRAERVVQWFSDHWPAGLEWPADIPRPAPNPDRKEAA